MRERGRARSQPSWGPRPGDQQSRFRGTAKRRGTVPALVKFLSVPLSPRARRESANAVQTALVTRSFTPAALSARTLSRRAWCSRSVEGRGNVGEKRNGPGDRSPRPLFTNASREVREEDEMAPHGGACTKPIGFTSRERAEVSRLGDRGVAESAEERPTARGCIEAPGRAGERGEKPSETPEWSTAFAAGSRHQGGQHLLRTPAARV
jgi:hypothetical protein